MLKFIADHNNKRVLFQISEKSFAVKKAIRKAMYKIGKDYRAYSREEILRGVKTGRIYTYGDVRNKKGLLTRITRKHQASAPGEFPANLSGTLRKSLNYNVVGSTKLIFGNYAYYSGYLEEGTPKMKARPFLKLTIEHLRQQTLTHLTTEIKNVL